MAVHGRFNQPCPVCAAPVQRIVYAENECNYCARCQTGGRRLADRAMSRLLGADWPRELDDEARLAMADAGADGAAGAQARPASVTGRRHRRRARASRARRRRTSSTSVVDR